MVAEWEDANGKCITPIQLHRVPKRYQISTRHWPNPKNYVTRCLPFQKKVMCGISAEGVKNVWTSFSLSLFLIWDNTWFISSFRSSSRANHTLSFTFFLHICLYICLYAYMFHSWSSSEHTCITGKGIPYWPDAITYDNDLNTLLQSTVKRNLEQASKLQDGLSQIHCDKSVVTNDVRFYPFLSVVACGLLW